MYDVKKTMSAAIVSLGSSLLRKKLTPALAFKIWSSKFSTPSLC